MPGNAKDRQSNTFYLEEHSVEIQGVFFVHFVNIQIRANVLQRKCIQYVELLKNILKWYKMSVDKCIGGLL